MLHRLWCHFWRIVGLFLRDVTIEALESSLKNEEGRHRTTRSEVTTLREALAIKEQNETLLLAIINREHQRVKAETSDFVVRQVSNNFSKEPIE